MPTATSTVDADEIERFSRLAETWWDPNGPMAPLHKINPLRVGYIRDKIVSHFELENWGIEELENKKTAFPGSSIPQFPNSLTVLDIGCGAGLVCEPLARLGAKVTGIDASVKNIEAARVHAAQSELEIDYRCTTAEDLFIPSPLRGEGGEQQRAGGDEQFDIVLALEIIEHVADIPAFVEATTKLVKPGGLLIYSTINRTAKSYALAIVGAEYILRWLPRGTHDWKKFVKPSELARELRKNNIEIKEMTGMALNPLTWKWELNPKDVDVNYLLVAGKPFN
jgi:2-polyprenyl-6-hydroxyphenyl methylase/3-demethylubiquinone-9 3-methyltransferase